MRDANELFHFAAKLPLSVAKKRKASSPANGDDTLEACHVSMELAQPRLNLVTSRQVDEKWARANVLFFYANTESAAILKAYNSHADKYLTNNQMVGAYGPISWPGIRKAVEALKQDPSTRRAVVSVVENARPWNANVPACISMMHFLAVDGKLDLHCYQRSLNAWSVLPYDLVVLTNLLFYVAREANLEVGVLAWTIGSLHVCTKDVAAIEACDFGWKPVSSLEVPFISSDDAWKNLHQGV